MAVSALHVVQPLFTQLKELVFCSDVHRDFVPALMTSKAQMFVKYAKQDCGEVKDVCKDVPNGFAVHLNALPLFIQFTADRSCCTRTGTNHVLTMKDSEQRSISQGNRVWPKLGPSLRHWILSASTQK